MESRFGTKLFLRPLDTPPEGYLASMASGSNPIKEQELRVAEEQHKLKIAQIEAKHSAKGKPASRKPASKKVKNG
ncbi:hypothetical protein UFOVP223_92 [uncultured Caudovirales phage]|uniref:Uncharacterized protein n=1 Tax=uncultured Caudovirales phage TaxID=2100421 RepID=A0A6J7WND9_9CAUD|nr:hypothetical protein UFOVP110_72 [uncultured Caudovirales phage]CAB5219551.1 hypothetical protein UFOVP223_92 [uncultured Caudovirales phage]